MKKGTVPILIVLIIVVVGLLYAYLFKKTPSETTSIPELKPIVKDDGVNTPVSYKINCFSGFTKDDLEFKYEDMFLKKYLLPQSILDCVTKNYNRKGKAYIEKGDVYINSANELVLYKASYFTGRNIIIVDGLIDIR